MQEAEQEGQAKGEPVSTAAPNRRQRVRRENELSTGKTRARLRRTLIGALAALALAVIGAVPANAAFTHKFEGQIELASGTNPQPFGVDEDGNILVWLDGEEVVARYDTNGNPAPFPDLGTHIIDGFGGVECPQVPTDCDRVPSGRFGPIAPENERRSMAVLDQSENGPAKGYIYVKNHDLEADIGEINVFAPTGRYLGSINEGLAQPWNSGGLPPAQLSIAPNGNVYIARGWEECCAGSTWGGQVDQYSPVDADPAHTVFVGQLRFGVQTTPLEVNHPARYVVGMGSNGAIVHSNSSPDPDFRLGLWRWYDSTEFQKPGNSLALARDYKPFPRDNNIKQPRFGFVNPTNNDLLIWGTGPGISLYRPDLRTPAGPEIATSAPEMVSGARQVAVDASGGANHGQLYIMGGENKVSVFSAPVPIPDVAFNEPDEGHTTATLHLGIGTGGGGEITGCEVEYGLTTSFGNSAPCDPAPPYTNDTEVDVDLEGLFTEADYYYRVKASNSNGTNITYEEPFHTVAVLDTETGPVTNLTRTTATLNGSLNPDGYETTYRFEYGLDTNYDLETEEINVGSESGEFQVPPVDIEDLQPGRTYHYRLVAENELGTTFGQDLTFTAPNRPLITGINSTNVLATSADLHARVNTYSLPASYYFEYGPTAAFGEKTSVENLVADASFQEVSAHVSGLQQGLTYFYRLVAESDYGVSRSSIATFDFLPPPCPNAHVRQQTGANYLPDCRAYELVSPARAGSIQLFPGDVLARLQTNHPLTQPDVKARYSNAGLASGPARFGYFGSLGGISGSGAPNFLLDHYVATRTPEGWETTYPGLKGNEAGVAWKGQCSVTFERCLDYAVDLSPANSFGRAPFPYLWDVSGELITRLPTNFSVVPEADHLTGDEVPSPDFSHFVFSSLDLAFAPGGLESAPGSVYDNAIGPKTVTIASRLGNGDHIPQDAGGAAEFMKVRAVTRDGSRILMSTLASGGRANLYLRVNNAITYEVSGGFGVDLLGMSADGTKVAFMSGSVLTPEDNDTSRDIYVWEEATDDIRLVSVGNGKGNSDDCNASWTGSCGVAPIQGERPELDDVMASTGDVYFYSPEQLDPNNPGVRNQRNLYHLNDGAVQYVTTFDPGTTANRMQISADGKHAAFLTRAELTGYSHKYFDNFGVERTSFQMYAFDAFTGDVQCASCNPTGTPPTILRSDPPGNVVNQSSADVMASKNGRFMSDDGRVAFATADRLAPRDTNRHIDVYEYVDGRPQLITSGTTDRDLFPSLAIIFTGVNTGLEAISRDGVDIYFSTYETLVSQDQNGPFIKMYVARVNGGFAVPGELLPCEAADECHGETSTPPSNPEVGTGTPYSVPGNHLQAQRRRAAKRKQRQLRRKRQLRKRRLRQRQLRKKRLRGAAISQRQGG
jgi:hypothetical protein